MIADDVLAAGDGHGDGAAWAHVGLPAADRLRANRLGLWLFLASEGFLFSAIIASRYYLVGLERPKELSLTFGLALTGVLLLSSATAWQAEVWNERGEQRAFVGWLLATIVLGSAFLVGVGWEWTEGLAHFPPSTRFGSAFFTLIGFHAFHLITGLIALIVVAFMGRDGHFGPSNAWPVEGVVKYWAFVDLAWMFIFPTIYLVR